MKIVAFDPSLNSLGFAHNDNDEISYGAVTPGKRKCMSRLNFHHDWVEDILAKVAPDLVVIEGYAMGVRGKSNNIYNMGEVGGIIRLLAYKSGAAILLVPPKTLKKFVTGNGNSDKDAMMQQVKETWGNHVNNDDEADAIGLLHLGTCYVDRKARRNYKHYSSVVDKVKYVSARL
jgi:crossover junction endodeoxyribonuclease RuvC